MGEGEAEAVANTVAAAVAKQLSRRRDATSSDALAWQARSKSASPRASLSLPRLLLHVQRLLVDLLIDFIWLMDEWMDCRRMDTRKWIHCWTAIARTAASCNLAVLLSLVAKSVTLAPMRRRWSMNAARASQGKPGQSTMMLVSCVLRSCLALPIPAPATIKYQDDTTPRSMLLAAVP